MNPPPIVSFYLPLQRYWCLYLSTRISAVVVIGGQLVRRASGKIRRRWISRRLIHFVSEGAFRLSLLEAEIVRYIDSHQYGFCSPTVAGPRQHIASSTQTKLLIVSLMRSPSSTHRDVRHVSNSTFGSRIYDSSKIPSRILTPRRNVLQIWMIFEASRGLTTVIVSFPELKRVESTDFQQKSFDY